MTAIVPAAQAGRFCALGESAPVALRHHLKDFSDEA